MRSRAVRSYAQLVDSWDAGAIAAVSARLEDKDTNVRRSAVDTLGAMEKGDCTRAVAAAYARLETGAAECVLKDVLRHCAGATAASPAFVIIEQNVGNITALLALLKHPSLKKTKCWLSALRFVLGRLRKQTRLLR